MIHLLTAYGFGAHPRARRARDTDLYPATNEAAPPAGSHLLSEALVANTFRRAWLPCFFPAVLQTGEAGMGLELLGSTTTTVNSLRRWRPFARHDSRPGNSAADTGPNRVRQAGSALVSFTTGEGKNWATLLYNGG